jgi:hypothetical protein
MLLRFFHSSGASLIEAFEIAAPGFTLPSRNALAGGLLEKECQRVESLVHEVIQEKTISGLID